MTKSLDPDPDSDSGEGGAQVEALGGSGCGAPNRASDGAGPSPRAPARRLQALASVGEGCPPPGLTVPPSSLADPSSPDSPMEAFTAPSEVRHFTDGSFPPGFVLQLFSHPHLRALDGKGAPREGRAAEGGLPPLESPSPGELPRETRGGQAAWALPPGGCSLMFGAWVPGRWGLGQADRRTGLALGRAFLTGP